MMFLNIENVALVAEKLLMMLKGQQTLMSHEQMIGLFIFIFRTLNNYFYFTGQLNCGEPMAKWRI